MQSFFNQFDGNPDAMMDARGLLPRRKPCDISLFQLNRYQLGTGASSVTPESTLKLIANPLAFTEYTGFGGGTKDQRNIFSDVSTLLVNQATVPVFHKGIAGDKIVHIIFLDETQCNGLTLNEVGLFVDNPFYKLRSLPPLSQNPNPPRLGDMSNPWGPSVFTDILYASQPNLSQGLKENPGSLLAAYRQFPEITKERDFSLLFRWSIRFISGKDNC